jgi:hypothetical protein
MKNPMVSPLQSYRHKKAKKRYVPGTRLEKYTLQG